MFCWWSTVYLENRNGSNIIGALSAVSTILMLTHLVSVRGENTPRLVVGGRRNWERHYLMIIEIILYTRASLGAAHQSVAYSACWRATTWAALRMCNFSPGFVCFTPSVFWSRTTQHQEPGTRGSSSWKSHTNSSFLAFSQEPESLLSECGTQTEQ